MRARLGEVEASSRRRSTVRGALRHRGRRAPARRRRQAVPAAAGAAGAPSSATRTPTGRRRRGRRRRADPPGHALPRRRHGRGRPAPRGAERQRPVGQLVAILVGDFLFARGVRPGRRRSAPRPSASRRGRSRGWSRARSARPSGPARARTRSTHYLGVVADKTGSLIATSARFGAMFGGALGRGRATLTRVRRADRRRPSSSPTTSSTSRSESGESGKTPGTDLREGVPTLPTADRAAVDRPGRRAAPVAAGSSP